MIKSKFNFYDLKMSEKNLEINLETNLDSNLDSNLENKLLNNLKINLETNVNLETRPNRPQLEKQKSKDLHVNFLNLPEITNEKKKYLTAKYGQNEINLIKKRLEIENWLSEQLESLKEFSQVSLK